jgi:hypothetical protein
MFTRDTLIRNHIAYGNNTFTHCTSTLIDNTTVTSTSSGNTLLTSLVGVSSLSFSSSTPFLGISMSPFSASSPSSRTSSSLSETAKFGTVIGVLVALLLLLLFFFFWRQRRSDLGKKPSCPFATESPAHVDPFVWQGHSPPHCMFCLHNANNSNSLAVVTSVKKNRIVQEPQTTMPSISTQGSYSVPPSSSSSTQQGRRISSSRSASTTSIPYLHGPPLLERHADAGAVTLERSTSGRLPPAYGEQQLR